MKFSSSICCELRRDVTGIGDAVQMLPVLRAFEQRGELVTFYAEHRQKPWMELFLADVRIIDEAPNGTISFTLQNSNYKDDLTWPALDRLTRFAERMEIKPVVPIEPIRCAEVNKLASQIQADLKNKPYILLAPKCMDQNRAWPMAHWAKLGEILKAAGFCVVCAGTTMDEGMILMRSGIIPYHTTPFETVALIKGSLRLVGNDSGLCHVAGVIGHKAISLCGPTSGRQVYGGYPTVNFIQAPKECTSCKFDPRNGWSYACKLGCEALYTLTPKQVSVLVISQIDGEMN